MDYQAVIWNDMVERKWHGVFFMIDDHKIIWAYFVFFNACAIYVFVCYKFIYMCIFICMCIHLQREKKKKRETEKANRIQ